MSSTSEEDEFETEDSSEELAVAMLSLTIASPGGVRAEDQDLFAELLTEALGEGLGVALSMMDIACHALYYLSDPELDVELTPLEWLQEIATHLRERRLRDKHP